MKMKNRLNLYWIIGILAVLLIGSLSISWATVRELPNIVSIALGLSSLILAIIAIVQAVTSGTHTDATLGAVRAAADEVRTVSVIATEATRQLADRIRIVETIPSALEEMRGSLALMSVSNRAQPVSSESEFVLQSEGVDYRMSFDEMYAKGARVTTLAMYVLLKAYRSGKPFDAASIFSNTHLGYLVSGAILSIRMVGLVPVQGEAEQHVVTDLGRMTEDVIDEWTSFSVIDADIKTEVDGYFA